MKKILYFWIAAILLSACATAEIQVDTANLTERYGENAIIASSDNITLVFSDAEGSKIVKFTSNKPWTAEFEGEKPDWLTFTPGSGEEAGKGKEAQMKLTVTQNGYDNRTASLRIKSEDKMVRFHIEQKQKDALTVTQSSFELPGEGGEIQIEVKANITYTYEVSSTWIKPLSTKGLSTQILKFQVLPTDVQKERTATIKIGSPNRTAEVVTVKQGPKYHLDAPSSCSVSDSRSEFIVRFDSNAKIVASPKRGNRVVIGSTVTLEDEKGRERVFTIVGGAEADSANGKISNDSPVGAACLGKKKGDVVEYEGPTGRKMKFTLTSVGRK